MPPVRDEESETQRKAHAKRVRETRRSTQGVTLEDLKSAEQLVKKKQQQENQQRTSELQQLVASQNKNSPTTVPSVSIQQPSSGKHTWCPNKFWTLAKNLKIFQKAKKIVKVCLHSN